MRSWLFSGILFLAHALLGEVRGAEPFKFQELNGRSLAIYEGSRPVLVYNHGEIEPPSGVNARNHSSYLHPIFGLDGEIITGDFPKDHVYHRGLYWAWSHITIAGREYDFWTMRGIRLDFQRWLEREIRTNSAWLKIENGWFVEDKKVMAEELLIKAHATSGGARAIDVELTWTPTTQPVTLAGAPGKSYGGFTFRFGSRSKTIITIPAGRTSDDLLMTNLPWADFSGDFGGSSQKLSGAAVFVHPSHPAFPPTWMTRHYGMLAVGWPGVEPRTLPPGQSITCRYRVWVHRGAPEAVEIQKAYEQYR